MSEFRVGKPVLQCAVAGQQNQTLAIKIEAPRRINISHVNVIRKCPAFRATRAGAGRELAQHVERFVEDEVTKGQARRYPNLPYCG
jgi:hypothetical protein